MRSLSRLGLAALCLFIAGPVLAGFSGTDLFLPMVGRQAGVFPSNWYTTVWIYNPGADAVTARLYLLERNTANPSPPFVDVLVTPGDTEKLDNVVETFFHVQVFGGLRVTAPEKLVVTSRVFSKAVGASDKDSVGQDFAGVPASFAIGVGESTQVLGVHQTIPAATSDSRFNFGFVETTGHGATVRVTAFDGNNANQGFKDFQVREFSQRQVAFKDHFPTVSTENARLQVEVISGAGKIIAYGSGIANGSQDPTTFEMTYADTLLGVSTIQHDGTLTGDGSAAAPLGLANAAVTLAKIGTTNAPAPPPPAAGVAALLVATPNVLTTDGSALSWQPAATGDITAVNTAVGSGLTGGVATGEANLAVATGGISTAMLADGSVTAAKVGSGQVVKSLNGLKDAVTLAVSGAVTLTPSGNTLTIGSSGLALPYDGSAAAAGGAAAFKVSNTSGGGAGVYGTSDLFGVVGSGGSAGVYGVGATGVGGLSTSNDGYGVYGGGTSAGVGVAGFSGNGQGVSGSSDSGTGVEGSSTSGRGVYGSSVGATGVNGFSTSGNGVTGQSNGASNGGDGGNGVYGYSPGGVGVAGYSDAGYGIKCYGNGGYTGSWSNLSDERLKKDVVPLADALHVVLALRGVSFTWRRDEFPGMHLNEGPQIGFIAQEVEPVLPEVVTTDPQGYKAIDYSKLTPVLLEAIKAQQAIIGRHESAEVELRSALAEFTTEVRRLRVKVEGQPARAKGTDRRH